MMYYNGSLISDDQNFPDVTGTNGVFDLTSHLLAKKAGEWPVFVDTSVSGDPTAGYLEVSAQFIESDVYMGGNSDYTGPYDVSEVTVPSSFSGSARIYLGHKVTSSTSFYSDIAVAGVQILNSTGTALLESYIFGSSTDNNGWENLGTATAIAGSSTTGFAESLSTSAARTYGSTITSGSATNKFNLATSTGSSATGAGGGINATTYKTTSDSGSGTIFPLGVNAITQVNSSYYIYVECSGTNQYQCVVCRSPAYTFSGGEKIRIAHTLPGSSSSPMDPDDTLYLGVA